MGLSRTSTWERVSSSNELEVSSAYTVMHAGQLLRWNCTFRARKVCFRRLPSETINAYGAYARATMTIATVKVISLLQLPCIA